MSQTGASDTNALRREVANVVRRMRAVARNSSSLRNVLGELAKLKDESADVLNYVQIAVARPVGAGQAPRVTFRINRELLPKTPRAFTPALAGGIGQGSENRAFSA